MIGPKRGERMSKSLTCYHCQKEITERSDLVVANRRLVLRPYHNQCFEKHIDESKEQSKMFFDAMPINRTYGNIMAVLFLILFAFLYYFVDIHPFIYVLSLIYPVYRIFSFFLYEIRLS